MTIAFVFTMQTLNTFNLSQPYHGNIDLVCFCHLRWDFVYQRPQHLLTRFANKHRVFYVEEPIFGDDHDNSLSVTKIKHNLWVITPKLKHSLDHEDIIFKQQVLLAGFFREMNINRYFFWYYTPMALEITNKFKPEHVVYDCMDELSNFKFANPELKQREVELFAKADVVFTGGHALYGAKKDSHHNIHSFPSSIDKEHFAQARIQQVDPEDQANIPYPRFGYYGVIDERFDIEMIREVAERRPSWHFVLIGPTAKIDPADLPRRDNIHFLGGKKYDQLPNYLGGWDVAIIPFLKNDATKYISPTKTPEYLAGGKPVISTSITDVVNPYFTAGLVHIADTAEGFIEAAEKELAVGAGLASARDSRRQWLAKVDAHLENNSWDNTWAKMYHHVELKLSPKSNSLTLSTQKAYV